MTDNQLLVDTSDVVHIDNEETIIGTKTFSRDTVVKNLSPMMTNCITDIPQDIKLTLSNGTLTLKSGSNIYYPNGSGVFTKVTTSTDYTLSVGSPTGNRVLLPTVNSAGTSFSFLTAQNGLNLFSGATAPTVTVSTAYWYDTTNNIIKRTQDTGATWSTISGAYICLPICLTTFSNDSVTSIDQIFNGFGYIGSTVFVLPGVKGLIPNGRNADGTLKNDILNVPSVFVNSYDTVGDSIRQITVRNTTFSAPGLTTFKYDEINNINLYNGNYSPNVKAGEFELVGGKITNLNIKSSFHALDYNDKPTISGWGMPGSKYINLTLLASGSYYTAPANGYVNIIKASTAAGQYISGKSGQLQGSSHAEGAQNVYLWLPVKSGEKFGIWYTVDGDTSSFRFIYAEGEV